MNNCICNEHEFTNPVMISKIYKSSVKAIVDLGFDGMKLDGCSEFHNTSLWSGLMNASGRPVLVENCHNTNQPKTINDWGGQCPFNWFRSSTDIQPRWTSIYSNLQTTTQYQGNPPLSRPGCWAYPVRRGCVALIIAAQCSWLLVRLDLQDMLEVGNLATFEENRAHFGAWCVVRPRFCRPHAACFGPVHAHAAARGVPQVSSPLILGYDLTNDNITDMVCAATVGTRNSCPPSHARRPRS